MTVRGTVAHDPVEGGIWTLRSDDGTVYQLHGGGKGLRKDGMRVVVEGEVEEEMMGFGMVGPILRVESYRADA